MPSGRGESDESGITGVLDNRSETLVQTQCSHGDRSRSSPDRTSRSNTRVDEVNSDDSVIVATLMTAAKRWTLSNVATEIEHKFLVIGDGWRGYPGTRYQQGYIAIGSTGVVRVRVGGGRAYLTIKGPTEGRTRAEYEYEIPQSDGTAILESLCENRIVDKTRCRIPIGEFTWEVDEFHGRNSGLVLAELEIEFEGQPFAKPDWVGADVSDDPRYTNAMLAIHPFSTWK